MASNYDSVLEQLRAAGIIVDDLRTGTTKPVRCKVEGSREKRGWYILHEINTANGDLVIVGSYGVWMGSENNSQKIEIKKTEFTDEQRESLRKRLADDRKRAESERKVEVERAAQVAAKAWSSCLPVGESNYLTHKGVGAHGLRFSPSGACVIPMLDTAGKVHGLQIVRSNAEAKAKNRLAKEFWPAGLAKKGHFHLIGMPTNVLLVCEGYATGASLYEATGIPVAIAFDANNLAPVAGALRKRYKRVKILVCGDDDNFGTCMSCKEKVILSIEPQTCSACGSDHKRINTGVTSASMAALEVDGAWCKPYFEDEPKRHSLFAKKGIKLSDFNDLHAADGLHAVRVQIEYKLQELGWQLTQKIAPAITTESGDGQEILKPIETTDELLNRFVLVYGQSGTVFDHKEHQLLSVSDMRDACVNKYVHRAWSEHPNRGIVRVTEVGFDPACDDPEIRCNLWAGWPTKPKAGSCEKLLTLLRYMCSAETNSEKLYQWVLNWVAYPIKFPGAKMKTTLVLHGPQGTGKNLFFEALMNIYGKYGRVIDQSAIEDRFNDWASRKLFLIADEVVARSDLYHVKNKLKAFITGVWIRINPKNMAAYDEKNHVNIVFLSNEFMPVVLEEDDRRHTVIWTPEKLDQEFYKSVLYEVANGGVEALHDYLINHDVGGFNEGTLPPFTDAKKELINLSMDSPSRFFNAFMAGEFDGFKVQPCLAQEFYDLYRIYCQQVGARPAPLPKFLNALDRKHNCPCVRKRYESYDTAEDKVKGPHSIATFGLEPPVGDNELKYYGENINSFRLALKDLKGKNRD